MNAYVIVEGSRTEMKVYPKWLALIAPKLKRVDHPSDIVDNNYFLFSGGGIPSIYNHIANAVEDILEINSKGTSKIDYLLVCIDTEDETREYILKQIEKELNDRNIEPGTLSLEVFEQKVSMESWFLANRKIFKSNPDDEALRRYVQHYNVKEKDPELMESIDDNQFSTKAQFHHAYLKKIFTERHMSYSKSNPSEVCKEDYLNQLIKRYSETGHIPSFGRWYDFAKTTLQS